MCPGVTKVLIDTYTTQVNHRIHLEKTVIEGDNKRSNRGQIISAALAFVCIGLGGVLTYLDKNIGGLALIFGSLGTLLTAFYGGAIIRKMNASKKISSLPRKPLFNPPHYAASFGGSFARAFFVFSCVEIAQWATNKRLFLLSGSNFLYISLISSSLFIIFTLLSYLR